MYKKQNIGLTNTLDVKRGGGIIGKVELPGGKYRLLSVLGRGATVCRLSCRENWIPESGMQSR